MMPDRHTTTGRHITPDMVRLEAEIGSGLGGEVTDHKQRMRGQALGPVVHQVLVDIIRIQQRHGLECTEEAFVK